MEELELFLKECRLSGFHTERSVHYRCAWVEKAVGENLKGSWVGIGRNPSGRGFGVWRSGSPRCIIEFEKASSWEDAVVKAGEWIREWY